jgi:tetratricopeptide (TPR) repeat protein
MRSGVLAVLFALAGAAVVAAVAGPAFAEGGGPDGAPTTTAGADPVGLLRSPFLGEREDGIRRLAAAGPEALAAARAALSSEPSPGVRFGLAETLAREGSPASLRALLERIATAPEPEAARLRAILVREPERAGEALRAWAAERPGPLEPPLADLEALVVRAEVQAIFVSRKSKSGYTGYYKGQYAPLEPARYRAAALEMCLHVMEDRAMPVPGTHRAGGFVFSPAPKESVEFAEVQGMAANAVVELTRTARAERVDAWVLTRLRDLEARRAREYADALETYGDVQSDAARIEKDEKQVLYVDVLQTLYILRPVQWERKLSALLDLLGPYGDDRDADAHATLLLRLGRYEEAIAGLERLLDSSSIMAPAHLHYNLACAYASWSLEPGHEDAKRLRAEALKHLTLAVENRWSDIGWMEQDRDLDPIRRTAEYADLVARIRRELLPGGG